MESTNSNYQPPQSKNNLLEHNENTLHSKLGIASFITTMLAGIIMLAIFIYAGVLEASTPGGMSEDSAEAIIIGFSFIGILFLLLVSLGLGIAGLFQKGQKKVFAILGTTFSSLIILGSVALLIVGMTMG